MTNHLHQSSHALLAAGTKSRHDSIISDAGYKCFIRDPKLAGIDAEARECSRGSQSPQRAFKCLLSAECLDCYVGAAAGEPFYFGHDVNVTIVECDVRSHSTIVTRSEEHTSELQSHSFISYAVFCLKKK